MAIALVQSKLCGNNSRTATTGGTITATGNFNSNTVAGNMIVGVMFHSEVGGQPTTSPITLTTPGVTYGVTGGGFGTTLNSPVWRGGGAIFIAANAPSVSAATTTTLSVTFGLSATTATETIEFVMFEFSGCTSNNSSILDNSTGSITGTSSTPNGTGTLTTTGADLIISAYGAQSGVVSAGSGFALGPTLTAVQFGQVQYLVNSSIGSVAAGFSGGTVTKWGGLAYAVFPASPTATNSYGFFLS